MRLIPLGTNGYIPSFGRQTMAFLVLTDPVALLLDAGTGVARLLEPGIRNLLGSYRDLHVILSHYHLDHVVGLSYLPAVWPQGTVTIYAPAPPLVEAQPDEALERLLQPPLFPVTLQDFPAKVRIEALRDERLDLPGLPVRLRMQEHPGRSVGIRLADKLVYMTDTRVDEGAAGFIRGVDLLLHEVWLTDEEAQQNQAQLKGHSYTSGVLDLASRSRVKRLMPVHLHPTRSNEEVEKLVASMRRGAVEVVFPREGEVYSLT